MFTAVIITLTLIASTIGTSTGFGTSTILIPFLSLYYPLPETLLFVGIIHWFGNVWKMFFFKQGLNWKLVLLFGLPGIIISFMASQLPTTLDNQTLKKILGLFLIAYVIFIFLRPRWKIAKNNLNAVLGGSLSGFFAGIFGVGGAVRSAFLSAFNLDKSVYLFTSGAIAILIDTSRLTGYQLSGIRLQTFQLSALIFAITASLFGAYLAKTFLTKVPAAQFRLLIALALLIVGLRYFVS